MMVSADEVHRSFRGTMELLHNRVEGLRAFDMSERGFWHSFAAILVTLPAYVVSVALERLHLGLGRHDLLGDLWIDSVVALGHVASFIALPVAMIWVCRGLGLTARYVPFVIVTNWISVAGMLLLSFPALLLLIGWAPPTLAGLFSIAFFVIVLRAQWFATRATLGLQPGLAAVVVGLGVLLDVVLGTLTRGLLG